MFFPKLQQNISLHISNMILTLTTTVLVMEYWHTRGIQGPNFIWCFIWHQSVYPPFLMVSYPSHSKVSPVVNLSYYKMYCCPYDPPYHLTIFIGPSREFPQLFTLPPREVSEYLIDCLQDCKTIYYIAH